VQAGSATPTYDAKGNLTYDGSTGYGYSSENMLIGMWGGLSYQYDPLGRWVALGTTGAPTRVSYDSSGALPEIVSEHDWQGNITRRHVFGPGTDEPLVTYEGAGASDRRFLHADERGSIVATTDSSGNATAVNRYDEYGVPASTNTGRFQYTGQPWIPEAGLYYYRARMYNPALGRFLQADPIAYGDGMNAYAYVGNNPVNRTHPIGLCQNGTNLFHNRMTFDGNTGALKSNVVTPLGFFCFDTVDANLLAAGAEREAAKAANTRVGGAEDKRCVRKPYSDFFGANGMPASVVAYRRSSDPTMLLGLTALESGWGRSHQATTQQTRSARPQAAMPRAASPTPPKPQLGRGGTRSGVRG
jgi:RHS repeat-associated protein